MPPKFGVEFCFSIYCRILLQLQLHSSTKSFSGKSLALSLDDEKQSCIAYLWPLIASSSMRPKFCFTFAYFCWVCSMSFYSRRSSETFKNSWLCLLSETVTGRCISCFGKTHIQTDHTMKP